MEARLPAHLAERLHWVVAPKVASAGEFVIYWMHHAVRGHENPALDVAICFARQLDLPLLVYHGICEEYLFASDRHHAFMIQGARDAERELGNLGVRYAFHLQRDGHRGPHLRELTRRAAVLVTDEMPLGPIIGWLDRLRVINVPIATVDTTCVVPARLHTKCYTRAYEFRDAAKPHLDRRLSSAYPTTAVDCRRFVGELPFEPVNLQDTDLRKLIGHCRIDHTIAPVADTPGGSRAGYARWDRFKQAGLQSYAERRNNAADHDGVSRMSPYLHYGMVSPFRIAREAYELGAEKYLDELLVWRELAFQFCLHQHDSIDSLSAIPDWAQQTLEDHQADPRAANYSWESLARAQTDHPLWDACQRSLLKHGELHNNLRMTWGKAFLFWTDAPSRALRMAIDLNHRYALDGRDPSSYGGVLWCFGQFDRPFESAPIYGRVRRRSLEVHEQRIDMPSYLQIVDRPICSPAPRVAVIGAGLGGLVVARTLADHGLSVEVFDKSRGVGGRMATRRNAAGLHFDHGAQYFTARDERFARQVQSWVHDGVVVPWHSRIVRLQAGKVVADKGDTLRYVAVPGMNAIARQLAARLKVSLNCEIRELQALHDQAARRWRLIDDAGIDRGEFDIVISNCPPPQSELLLGPHTPLSQLIAEVQMLPCWAAMVTLQVAESPPYDAAFVDGGPLSWICRNDSKPLRGRDGGSCWVLHASSQWSLENLEAAPSEIERLITEAFCNATGMKSEVIAACEIHRWRYAIPESVLSPDCLWDAMTSLGACGDWCGGPRVEGAFLSGAAMAGAVLRELTIDRKSR